MLRPFLLLVSIVLVGMAFTRQTPTPYSFTIPGTFGNRFTIPADNPTTQEGVELGRYLFYDSLLSKNNTISCSSCHQQNKAFTDGLSISIGVSGRPTFRNSMSLVNLLWVRDFFWDGHSTSLEAQALVPMAHPDEMGLAPEKTALKLQQTPFYPGRFEKAFGTSTITADLIAKALAQFERTLISANAPYDQYLQGKYILTEAEKRGMHLFMHGPEGKRGGNSCAHCHGSAKFFQNVFHNNGLDKSPLDPGRQDLTGIDDDFARFRVPTLRNIAITAPYMHDGRFLTLDQVIDHYSDHIEPSRTLSRDLGGSLHLTPSEKKDLLAFLHTLTDSTFLTDQRFSNPFLKY
ncbi:MAG: cytochrome c peroxidase [Siphonobacter sp.]